MSLFCLKILLMPLSQLVGNICYQSSRLRLLRDCSRRKIAPRRVARARTSSTGTPPPPRPTARARRRRRSSAKRDLRRFSRCTDFSSEGATRSLAYAISLVRPTPTEEEEEERKELLRRRLRLECSFLKRQKSVRQEEEEERVRRNCFCAGGGGESE